MKNSETTPRTYSIYGAKWSLDSGTGDNADLESLQSCFYFGLFLKDTKDN